MRCATSGCPSLRLLLAFAMSASTSAADEKVLFWAIAPAASARVKHSPIAFMRASRLLLLRRCRRGWGRTFVLGHSFLKTPARGGFDQLVIVHCGSLNRRRANAHIHQQQVDGP